MNSRKKGSTLLEVLVSITIFSIVFVGLFSSLLVMRQGTRKQEEFTRFETICRDIAFYVGKYKESWDNEYELFTKDDGIIYYSNSFSQVSSEEEATYTLSYTLDPKPVITITHIATDRKMINELDYGGSTQ